MALVKAIKSVYLGEYGYHPEGEVFEYAGPKNKNLEPVDDKTSPKPSQAAANK